jgi:hypothetical protein
MTNTEVRLEHTNARIWALAAGLPVGRRGRVSMEILTAYRASQAHA